MRRLLRALLVVVVLLLALAAASPGLIYLAALGMVHGRPEPVAAPPLSAEQQNWLRCELGGGDNEKPTATNPWQLGWHFLKEDSTPSYGDRMAWIVARDYAGVQVDHPNLSSIALFVWVARHWNTQQLEARSHELLHQEHHFQCTPSPAEWPQTAPAR